jgi:hypothetical protein
MRGVADVPFETPAFANRLALMGVIRDHVSRYVALYFDSDSSLAGNEFLGQWLDRLRLCIPHGVDEIVGSPVTIEGAVKLLSTFIYLTTVEHEIVDAGVWNYQLWSDVQPSRVYQNGLRQPLDVFQRFVSANFTFQIPRTLLMNDFSSLAIDQRGATAFRTFLSDLAGLQRLMDGQPAACWRIEPRNLKANINA